MRTTLSVSLTPDLRKWVDEQVKAGGYATAGEYMRDMLRRARERQARRRVDDLMVEAVESGATTVMDDADWAALRAAARAEAAKPARVER